MRELTDSEKKMIHDFISLSICSVFDPNPVNTEAFSQNVKTICKIAGVDFETNFASELWMHIDSIRTGIAIAKSFK